MWTGVPFNNIVLYMLIINDHIHVHFVGGAFVSVQDTASPFGYKRGEGIDAGKGETGWVVTKERQKYDAVFNTLEKSDGKLSGAGTKLLYRAMNLMHCKIHLKLERIF